MKCYFPWRQRRLLLRGLRGPLLVTPRARLHLILYSRGALVKIRVELGVSGGKEGKHVTTLHRLSFEEAHYGTLSSR